MQRVNHVKKEYSEYYVANARRHPCRTGNEYTFVAFRKFRKSAKDHLSFPSPVFTITQKLRDIIDYETKLDTEVILHQHIHSNIIGS